MWFWGLKNYFVISYCTQINFEPQIFLMLPGCASNILCQWSAMLFFTLPIILKLYFLSSPIACVACERTELLGTEITIWKWTPFSSVTCFLRFLEAPKYRNYFWYLWYVWIFSKNFFDEFFWQIFSTNFFDECFRRMFSTNFFDEFFFSTNFFDDSTNFFFLFDDFFLFRRIFNFFSAIFSTKFFGIFSTNFFDEFFIF